MTSRSEISSATEATARRASATFVVRQARRKWLQCRLSIKAAGPLARRSLDIVIAGTALLLLLPVFVCVALAIKLTSRGPVFFVQPRIGKNGQSFPMFKLRTMVVDAEALKARLEKAHAEATDGVRFKMVRDPRITALGRILRKLSIDELPQLWNVLRGDMTVVGPRPPVWKEVARYTPRELRRLEVTPGLTCLWQVRGRSDLSFAQQVELDIEYIDRARPVDEVRILLETVPAVVTGRGAY